jgi:hypothetical protein
MIAFYKYLKDFNEKSSSFLYISTHEVDSLSLNFEYITPLACTVICKRIINFIFLHKKN